MVKQRTGKECKMTKCKNYEYYANWARNLGRNALTECMECKHSHVSQYQKLKEIFPKGGFIIE